MFTLEFRLGDPSFPCTGYLAYLFQNQRGINNCGYLVRPLAKQTVCSHILRVSRSEEKVVLAARPIR